MVTCSLFSPGVAASATLPPCPPTNGQTAIIQSKTPSRPSGLALVVAHDRPLPPLPTPYHVRVRVLAVGLNPTDHKMVTHFFMQDNTAGCDFCGIVEELRWRHGINTREASFLQNNFPF